MLENKKNVRKFRNILIVLITIITVLSIFIKIAESSQEKIEVKTIGIDKIKHMKLIDMEHGSINPIYKPEWTKVSSTLDTTNQTLSIVVKGDASKSQTINGVDINYNSNVTSTLQAEDITVFIDGEEATSIAKEVSAATPSATGAEVTHTITLSGFEETLRQEGKNFKEWSGNVAIKIGGRGQDASTYTEDVLTDIYGNQSMMETDQDGSWVNVTFKDGNIVANTDGKMFTDFIKPEYTYEYANTIIDHDTKKVTIVFDVTDKYFTSSKFTVDDIVIAMIGDETSNVNVDIRKSLALKTIDSDVTNATTGITYKTDGSIYYNDQKVGQRYELALEGLEQLGADGLPNGYTYSGPMSIALPAGEVNADGTLKVGIIDNSGNLNSAKTITVGIDETDGNMNTDEDGNQQVVDVVDPIWSVGTSSTNEQEKNATIKLTGKDKYFKESTLTTDKIKIYANGVESTGIVKSLSTPTDIRETVDGVDNVVVGKEYTLTLSNLEPSTGGGTGGTGSGYYTEFTSTSPIVGGKAKFRNENGGNMTIEIEQGTIEDQYQNFSNTQTFNMGVVDATAPEVYEVQKTKDTTAKTETIIFNVTDKNYDATDLVTKDEITVFVDGEQVDGINKSSLTSVEIKTTIDGTEKIVGHQYTLVLSDFESATKNANGYKDWSGTVSIKIAEDASRDTKGNTLNPATTTISDFEDFLKPQIEKVTVSNPIDTANKTYTFKFTAIDKYMNISDLITPEEIKVYVDGVETTTVAKNLTNTPINKTFKKTVDGSVIEGTYTIGHEYTLVLSGFEETEAELTASGRNYTEWSGNVSIEVIAGAVKDKGPNGDDVNPNQNDLQPISGDFVDFIKPVVRKVSSTKDTTAKTETITFNVMDKYLDTTDALEDSEITVYVDGEEATTLTKTLTKVQDFIATVNGDTTHVVGQQYQLVLSDFEQTRTSINRNREYSDWSGTVTIEVAQGAVKDKGPKGDSTNPNINDKTSIDGDFVDYIAPNVTYEYVTGNIDYTGKTFTMVFDITDKYFANSTLATEYANATTEAEKLAVLQDYLTIRVDGEDITNNSQVTKKLVAIEDIKAGTTSYPLHKTIDGDVKTLDGTDTTLEEHRIIGKRYTLEISNLEQEVVGVGDEYLDYSGVITVAIKEGTAKDTTANENTATTLTSGVNIPGGTGTGTIVDVVDPLWEVAGTATAKPVNQTASIPIKGTDKYLKTIGLTASDITVEVNGVAKTSADGVTVSVVEDTSTTLAYGKQYRVTVNGYARDAYQVKITLREGLMVDNSGNRSKETSFILFSSLKETSTETDATSPFIGNTNIQRQKIEKIIFKDNLDGINDTRWDVSQLQDGSIWGWYTTDATTGNYTVYIGSYIIVNGNVNSSYLFSHIGYDSSCKVTGNTGATDGTEKPLIENIELLHVDSVTNMSSMFQDFGFSTMKSFDLGNAFDTGAVTNMSWMYMNCGQTAMTSLDLGEQFDTSNVTSMGLMFAGCGYTAITSFDLGNKFDTSKVQSMYMMFTGFGNAAMTSLDLGDKFNTSNVTNMYAMFDACGTMNMTSLDLGDKFDTSNVTDMREMFQSCGEYSMVALDLGPNFTKIADSNTDFMTDCGTTGAVIYAPEAIYKDLTSFKLNSGDTSTASGAIPVDAGRTINPIYKPEWEKVSSSLDKTTNPENPTLSVVVKANASKTQTINGVNINYNSDVTSALTPSNVYVYIDGELDGDTNKNGVLDEGETPSITKAVTSASPSATSAEITHTITLSNFEETLRQSGKNFKEWSGNIAIKVGGRGEATSTYTANVLKDVYGNQNMMETDATGSWIDVKFKDEDTDHNTDGTMFEDFIKPEFTYEYLNTIIDHDTKTVTVVFDVTDKYFNESALTTDTTASNIDVTFDGTTPTNATKTLTKIDDLTATVNGTSKKVGERYQLVLTNLDQGGGGDYSGVMTLAFPANIITDKSGNANVAKTITVGIDDPTTGDGDDSAVIVDVVDPIWKVENINIDETNKKVTADLIATDKYLTGVQNSTLTTNDITVSVDGDTNANTTINKALTEPTFSTNETTGLKEIKYTLTLENFEEAARQSGKSFLEYSGNVKIKIAAGTVTDDASGESVSPSTLFDADGTNPNGLHIGDFVNYDAGTWTQEEINGIQTGLKTNLQIANGSTDLPSNYFQFGGFAAGSSRNGNVSLNSDYDAPVDYYYHDTTTGNGVSGWRVFDIEDDVVTLVSGGNPESFFQRGV